tara:strand:+ start:4170 stop:4550 length:381 start_codon:yes stop_codon:yes gene_type:complete
MQEQLLSLVDFEKLPWSYMNKFEAVLILNPELSTTLISKEIDKFKNSINSISGIVKSEEDWGLRELNFNINKFKKGFYKFLQIEANGQELSKLRIELNQNDNLLRYLFVKVKNHQELPTKLYNEKK